MLRAGIVALLILPLTAAAGKVTLQRAPAGGIQPQIAVDQAGTIHMVYYKGDPGHGDLYYVRSRDGGTTFSAPLRVNSISKRDRDRQHSRRQHRQRAKRQNSRRLEWIPRADTGAGLWQGADAIHEAQ